MPRRGYVMTRRSRGLGAIVYPILLCLLGLLHDARAQEGSVAPVGAAQGKGEVNSELGDPNAYLGSLACSGCHAKIYQHWQGTKHASAMLSLGRDRSSKRCLPCHSTGLSASLDRSVGCEACHGPGGAYATADIMQNKELATLLGMADLSGEAMSKRCLACHELTSRLVPFDANAAWKRIAHPRLKEKTL